MSLRNKIIRLAYQNPSLRNDLLPLVKISANYTGNYDSTWEFIDTHRLSKEFVQSVFGVDWGGSGDYDYDHVEIKMLLKALRANHTVLYVDSDRRNRDNFEEAKAKYFPKMKHKSNSGELFVF